METATGSNLSFLIMMLLIFGVIALIVSAIKHSRNQPTMKVFGLLPLYLILCICGIMGEERNKFNR